MIDESTLIWLAVAATALAIVVPYVVNFRRRLRYDEERKAEASALGIDRPTAQYPFIDPAHCIGCGACVAACPEGDVLGIVGGTAVVVNGLKCVGHARCEIACPVGAITVGLGDLASRSDVPLLDDNGQTTAAGVYVVGELGGLALVRNAVAQGKEVARHLAAELPAASNGAVDVVVVGAGPAGLATALALTAAGRTCRVLERETSLGGSLLHYPRRKMVLTQPVALPPWGVLDREEYQKERLLEMFEEIANDHGLDVRFGQEVVGVEEIVGGRLVTTAGGEEHRTAAVVLALGKRGKPRKLGVPGEELPKVAYRLLDAASYAGRRVLVVGGGDSAAEAAIGLAQQPGCEVTLSYRRDRFVRLKSRNEKALDESMANGRIVAMLPSTVTEIQPQAVVLDAGGERHEIANDDVFVFAGGVPPYDFLRRVGVQMGGEATAGSAGREPSRPSEKGSEARPQS